MEEDFFQQGMKVRISQGTLQGLEGFIIKRCGGTRLLLKIENLKKAYSINIAAGLVEPC
ncbi:MAG: hypothetical protein ING88_16720 [Cytophagales bacterium]|nr:hypothetical protein [Cytophagales bacterium]MCA6375739.1 hypothetical protein [Cytophagales bacterium]